MHSFSKSELAREQFYQTWWLRALRGVRYRRGSMILKSLTVLLVSTLADTLSAVLWLIEAIIVEPRIVRKRAPESQPEEQHEFENRDSILTRNIWR